MGLLARKKRKRTGITWSHSPAELKLLNDSPDDGTPSVEEDRLRSRNGLVPVSYRTGGSSELVGAFRGDILGFGVGGLNSRIGDVGVEWRERNCTSLVMAEDGDEGGEG